MWVWKTIRKKNVKNQEARTAIHEKGPGAEYLRGSPNVFKRSLGARNICI